MSSPKGYPSSTKISRTASEFTTVEPVSPTQLGMSVAASLYVYAVGAKAVVTATQSQINTVGHGARRGDIIRFTSGALSDYSFRVYSVIDADNFSLAEDMSSAPSVGDTYILYRHTRPNTDQSGNIQVSFSYSLNGIPTGIIEDTVTPANNRPLPTLLLDAAGNVNTVAVSSSALPTGAATAAKQDTGNTSLASLDFKILACNTGAVVVSSSALPSGAAVAVKQDTANTSLASIDGKITACNTGAVTVAASALPTGAATEATLSAQSAKLPATLGQKVSTASFSVVLASDQSAVPVSGTFWQATQPISAAALPLPAGAATENTLSVMSSKIPVSLGNHLMNNSLSVTMASDQTAIPASQSGSWSISEKGYAGITFIRNDYSSVPVTTGAYVQLVASLAADCQEIDIFESGGNSLYLAIGGAGSEINKMVICPGGNGVIKLAISAGTRVSVKAVATNSSLGELIINFRG